MGIREQMGNLRKAVECLCEVMVEIDVKDVDYEIYRNITITLQGLLYRYEVLKKTTEEL